MQHIGVSYWLQYFNVLAPPLICFVQMLNHLCINVGLLSHPGSFAKTWNRSKREKKHCKRKNRPERADLQAESRGCWEVDRQGLEQRLQLILQQPVKLSQWQAATAPSSRWSPGCILSLQPPEDPPCGGTRQRASRKCSQAETLGLLLLTKLTKACEAEQKPGRRPWAARGSSLQPGSASPSRRAALDVPLK